MPNSPARPGQRLSLKEIETVRIMSELGPDYARIGTLMGVSVNTVKTWTSRARIKLGLRPWSTATDLVEAAVRAGVTDRWPERSTTYQTGSIS